MTSSPGATPRDAAARRPLTRRPLPSLALLAAGLWCGACVGPCFGGTPSEPMGQFGPYHARNKQLRLADGDTFTVYRVKYWTFDDGSAPALQLEFASPVPVSDTAGVRRAAERIWPAFAPYVEGQRLRAGILTATNLEKVGGPGAWATRAVYFGLVARRDSAGTWRFDGHPEALPTPAPGGEAGEILEADGQPFRMAGGPRR